MSDWREYEYWLTRCRYCEAPLRRDGGCCMWYGEPHDLPYRERAGNKYSVKLDRDSE